MGSTPRTIGRFEIRRELGRGMMGVVYEAHDPVLSRTVALKTVNPMLAAASEELDGFERRFETEARIAARLSHPNIVVVHDVGRDTETGTLYMALERLPGESLASLLRQGERLPWRRVLEIGRQLADALHHAHSQGVVHRDIKPANVMLLPSGQAKVMDFGIAKLEAAQMTAAGQFFGTPLFMCPEQASSERVDGRGDIFSLGSVLYTLLSGRHAFAANTVAVIVYRVMHEDPPPPSSLDPSLPTDVDLMVARCLAKKPDERYANAAQLSEDLSDILEGRAPRHASTSPAPQPAPSPAGAAVPELPGPQSPTLTVAPSPQSEGGQTRTLVASALPQPPGASRRRRWLGAAALAWLVALATGLYLPQARTLRASVLGSLSTAPGGDAPATSIATPEAEREPAAAAVAAVVPTAEPTPAPTPVPTPTPLPPATIVVDFRHPLRSGTLRVWMDDEVVLGERVKGRVEKDLLVMKLRSGVHTDIVEVPPGRHDFRVDVRWDDELRSERIPGRVYSGQTYRLEIRLGRISKDLSLNWTR